MKKEFLKIEKIIDETLNNNIDNKNLIKLYWNIGNILYISDFSYDDLVKLERYLQTRYGIIIGFTRRNLLNMKKFYKTYFNDKKIYFKLEKVNWYKHLWIMNNGKENKDYLLDICINYDIKVSDLKDIIKSGDISKYKKTKIFDNNNDEMVKELINLQNRMQKV